MQKKVLVLFFIAIALGSSLILFSRRNNDDNRAVTQNANIFDDVNVKLSPIVNRLNRTAIYFGVSISKTGRFSVEGENVSGL